MRSRAALLALLASLCLVSWARAQDPNPLLATTDGADVFLSWSPSTPPYTVLRGTDPALLAPLASTAVESWTDGGAADPADRNNYYYAVEDSSPSGAIRTNMAFKLSGETPRVEGGLNYHVPSFPLRPGFPDLWTGSCWGADGLVRSDDVLALWYPGDGSGSFFVTLISFDRDPLNPKFNRWWGQTMRDHSNFCRPATSGTPFSISDGTPQGFLCQLGSPPIEYRLLRIGSHDDTVTSWRLEPVPGCLNYVPFSIPPHTTWRTSQEILFAAWNGRVNQTPGAGFALSFFVFDNDPASPTFNRWRGQTVIESPVSPGRPVFSGRPVPLVRGDGCLLQISKGSTDLPLPHY